MDNDTQAPSRRTNILFRRVVLPGWVQVIVLIASGCAIIDLLITHPILVAVALMAYVALHALVLSPLRRLTGQGTDADDKAAVSAAPTMEAALTVIWQQMRTYPMWLLIVIALAMVDGALGLLGFPSI